MKRVNRLFAFAVLATPLFAQSSGKIYAQKLVDQAIAKHPEVVVMAMQVPLRTSEPISC
jgi:hypothetical protein